jgi:hypothetical protein
MALYQEQYGQADSRSTARRRQRLRERLVRPFSGWNKSARAPLSPLTRCTPGWTSGWRSAWPWWASAPWHELVFWIRTKGFHWHRGIPRVGPEGAARIVRWLREHEATPGRPALPCPGAVVGHRHHRADPAARVGIVPLERFRPPTERDGSQGTNRAAAARCKVLRPTTTRPSRPGCAARPGHAHLARLPQGGRALPALGGDAAPQGAVLAGRRRLRGLPGLPGAPGSEWTGPRNAQRWSGSWRPFEGALSVRSQALAITIVRSLCEWLVRRHYLDSNPWDDVPGAAGRAVDAAAAGLVAEAVGPGAGWLADACAGALPCPAPASVHARLRLHDRDAAGRAGRRQAGLAAA